MENKDRRIVGGFAALIATALLSGCGGGSGDSSTPPAMTYMISGEVDHLSAAGLVLNNGTSTLTVGQGATSFAFPIGLPNAAGYNVTVTTQPTNETCVVNQGAGTIAAANVGNVDIACNTSISAPLALGVYPASATQTTGPRVFIPVTVGNEATSINAILDTGSAGVVLNAYKVFPSSMVAPTGFVFPVGKSSITFNGITVTNVAASRSYGSQTDDPTTVTGNLGYAQLTFGTGANLTTAVVPVLFFYQLESSSGMADLSNPDNTSENFIGINAELESVSLANVTPASNVTQVCAGLTPSNCGLVSPLRSVTYDAGVDSGYLLNQFTLQGCDINTPGSCTPQNALMAGIGAVSEQGFALLPLDCKDATDAASTTFKACSQVIKNSVATIPNASFTGSVIIDSGVEATRLSVPAGQTFPQTLVTGTPVSLTLGSYTYQYTTGTGPASTTVVENASSTAYSNTGIEFFTNSSMLLDYTTQTEGWR